MTNCRMLIFATILLLSSSFESYGQEIKPLYEDIQWAWFDTSSDFAKKRADAIAKYQGYFGEFVPLNIFKEGRYAYTEKRVFTTLQFRWEFIEDGGILGVTPTRVPREVTDELLRETLPYLPDLKCIVLSMTSVTNEGLRALSCLKYLEDVRIISGDPKEFPVFITSKGLELLAKQHQLKSITLIGIDLSDHDLRPLRDMQSLETIVLDHCPVTPECFRIFASLPKVQKIVIGGTDFSSPPSADLCQEIASMNGRLKWIDISAVQPSNELTRAVLKIKSLEHIYLAMIPPEAWSELESMQNVQTLKTHAWPFSTPISDETKKSFRCDPDWIRFYSTKIKPKSALADQVRFWSTQLNAHYPEIDAWIKEIEQNKINRERNPSF